MKTPLIHLLQAILFRSIFKFIASNLLRKFGGSFCVNDNDAVWMVL